MDFKFKLVIVNDNDDEINKEQVCTVDPINWRANESFCDVVKYFSKISRSLGENSYVTTAAYTEEELDLATELSNDIQDYLYFLNTIKSVMGKINKENLFLRVKKKTNNETTLH